ncbi:MAG: FG-GAP repeat protein [Planctomycetes bacterium]|nr:FG-GAP repeat protein [Planctomycetota bacterium]
MILLPLTSLLLLNSLTAQAADWERLDTIRGQALEVYPVSGAVLDDVDGDGVADWVCGSPYLAGASSNEGLLHLLSGRDGSVLWRRSGDHYNDQLGTCLVALDDVDGDGFADFAAGAPSTNSWGRDLADVGSVEVRSGATGDRLWLRHGFREWGELGRNLAAVPDLDGDGLREVASAAYGGSRSGEVLVYSGASGALLLRIPGSGRQEEFGAALAAAGDLDGDGLADLLIGAPRSPGAHVEAWSSRSGQRLLRIEASALGLTQGDFGRAVLGLPDQNGDGVPDLAVGAPWALLSSYGTGALFLLSGADGSLIQAFLPNYGVRRLGASLAAVGDLNADGWPDFAAGAPDSEWAGVAYAGSVFLRSGRTGRLLHRLNGDRETLALGTWSSPAGDLDRDGRDDLLVGRAIGGAVLAYSGRSGRTLRRLDRGHRMDTLGSKLAAAGDFDGDGRADLVATRRDLLSGSQEVVVLAGTDHRVLLESKPDAWSTAFGSSLHARTDFNLDGVPDLLIGWPDWSTASARDLGRCLLVSGATGAELLVLDGAAEDDRLGARVAALPDRDGDGVPEILVTAPNSSPGGLSQAGELRLHSGATGALLQAIPGVWAGENFGGGLAVVGDLDGDGYPDLAVGAPWHEPAGGGRYQGRVQAFSGWSGHPLFERIGAQANDLFGAEIAGLRDVDLDGIPDFAVAAPWATRAGVQVAGEVTVHSGRDGRTLFAVHGTGQGGLLGTRLFGLDDADGDGVADFAASAPNHDVTPYGDEGALHLYSGADGRLLKSWYGEEPEAWLGRGAAALGDVDGDGCADLAIGVPGATRVGEENAGRIEVWSAVPARPVLRAAPEWRVGADPRLEVRGAAGTAVAFLLSANGPGPTWVPSLGLELALSRPFHLLGTVVPDSRGTALLHGRLTPSMHGRTFWLQSLDDRPSGAVATNPIARVVR